eukprot:CAMPEP_0170621652 /NCGR_PEP_ID=MMETSP0224-20130122/28712_1 /TAXON_ID=285029 /ORGANISM="Togula jolla, Strain CCCM 725" /LENGTH=124 /DNA_ID=CAMNT_0010947919 /DNA_START=60 /DNA_END=435 /DNA_ORIENTATION=+
MNRGHLKATLEHPASQSVRIAWGSTSVVISFWKGTMQVLRRELGQGHTVEHHCLSVGTLGAWADLCDDTVDDAEVETVLLSLMFLPHLIFMSPPVRSSSAEVWPCSSPMSPQQVLSFLGASVLG